MDIDTPFSQWFENEFADNIDEGSRTHTNLHSAFEAGVKLGIKNGKKESVAVMRKFFETDFVNCLDAIEEILL